MTRRNPFRHFKTSPEIIRLAVMMYIRFPLSPSGAVSARRKGQRPCPSGDRFEFVRQHP